MKKIICVFIVLFLLLTPLYSVSAHSGRTDSSGGHNCSEKSISKGLCSGYHYHNGGSAKTPKPTAKPTPKPTTKPTAKPTVKPTAAKVEPIKLIVNGKPVKLEVKNIDQVNYVSLKEIASLLGYEITIDTKTNTITLSPKKAP